MPGLIAMAVSVGLFGGVATWLFLSVGTLLLWGSFIAWASFFAIGGAPNLMVKNIVSNVYGAVIAWVVMLLMLANPLGMSFAFWAGIVVALSIVVFVLTSQIEILNFIPAVVFGYATIFAYAAQTPEALSLDKLLTVSLENGLILSAISLVLGSLLGVGSVLGTQFLTKSEVPAAT